MNIDLFTRVKMNLFHYLRSTYVPMPQDKLQLLICSSLQGIALKYNQKHIYYHIRHVAIKLSHGIAQKPVTGSSGQCLPPLAWGLDLRVQILRSLTQALTLSRTINTQESSQGCCFAQKQQIQLIIDKLEAVRVSVCGLNKYHPPTESIFQLMILNQSPSWQGSQGRNFKQHVTKMFKVKIREG